MALSSQFSMQKCNSRACARSRSTTTRVQALLHAEKSKTETYSGKSVNPPAQGKHFLHLDDFTKDELLDMLDRAKFAKAKFYARDESFKPFKGMSMAMIFTKPSARTRVSFETVRPAT
jgi:ornithine carbamoyltransferase